MLTADPSRFVMPPLWHIQISYMEATTISRGCSTSNFAAVIYGLYSPSILLGKQQFGGWMEEYMGGSKRVLGYIGTTGIYQGRKKIFKHFGGITLDK